MTTMSQIYVKNYLYYAYNKIIVHSMNEPECLNLY